MTDRPVDGLERALDKRGQQLVTVGGFEFRRKPAGDVNGEALLVLLEPCGEVRPV